MGMGESLKGRDLYVFPNLVLGRLFIQDIKASLKIRINSSKTRKPINR